MKRFMLLFTGVLMAVSLAACTPTQTQADKEKTSRAQPPAGAAEQSTVDGAAEKVPDADAEPSVMVSIYSVKEDKSGLKQDMDAIDAEELDAQLLVDKLAENGVIESGIQVLSFVQKDGVLTLDLSGLSKSDDKLLLAAIANTFLQNYEETDGELALTVKGEPVADQNLKYVKEYKTMK